MDSLSNLLHRFQPRRQAESIASVNIITYRLGRDMVYVPLAVTYTEALSLAMKVFPRLAGIDSDQICFTLTVTLRGQQFPVRISPMTWQSIRDQVIQFEILDVAVADKVLWEGIKDLEASPSVPPPLYSASAEPQGKTSGFLNAMYRLFQKVIPLRNN